MENQKDTLDRWLSLSDGYFSVQHKLEQTLQEQYQLSLKEFYTLYFISNAEDKELRLQQLQEMIGLSQSATSRLVVRMEAKSCGALERHICEDDKRGIYTRITELGENKLQRALTTFNEMLQQEIQPEQFIQLQHVFKKNHK
ncbi:MarR family transcriptional regulator [Paenibacillus sp. PsM32]|uniref:MarR family winged helix-turn-helix transcriptional regulator n=1 Tax=Paenibacillus sp. PsM32 TaxID=3030536 RepID=UPI00263BBC39|nr:MarR family transcriptional regulator [Paenibacillus sp. PsM32]MDN4619391.1 MarR family transcriptional regulator [Paenibacillus sp. PsM32]